MWLSETDNLVIRLDFPYVAIDAVLQSRHFFGRLRMFKVPELTPAPGKKSGSCYRQVRAAPAPATDKKGRLLTLIFFHLRSEIFNYY